MNDRFLTITLQTEWQAGLRSSALAAKKTTYQGEVLNFESPGHFFGQLTEKRWSLVRTAQGKGELSVREHMSLILRRLTGGQFIEFSQLFDPGKGVGVLVVNFLAVLELVRESLIEVTQSGPFETIYVKLAHAESR